MAKPARNLKVKEETLEYPEYLQTAEEEPVDEEIRGVIEKVVKKKGDVIFIKEYIDSFESSKQENIYIETFKLQYNARWDSLVKDMPDNLKNNKKFWEKVIKKAPRVILNYRLIPKGVFSDADKKKHWIEIIIPKSNYSDLHQVFSKTSQYIPENALNDLDFWLRLIEFNQFCFTKKDTTGTSRFKEKCIPSSIIQNREFWEKLYGKEDPVVFFINYDQIPENMFSVKSQKEHWETFLTKYKEVHNYRMLFSVHKIMPEIVREDPGYWKELLKLFDAKAWKEFFELSNELPKNIKEDRGILQMAWDNSPYKGDIEKTCLSFPKMLYELQDKMRPEQVELLKKKFKKSGLINK